MVRKVNIISQRLFLNLLPNHKNSILYFNYFFRYKVFLDCILVNFLKKFRNIFLVDFYLGYSKSSFYLNLFIFFYKKDCIVDKFSQVRQLKGNLYLNCFVNNLFKSFYNLKNLSIFLGLVTKLRKIDFFLPFLFYSLKPNSLFFNTLLFSKLKNFEFWKSFNLTKLNYVVYTNYYFLKNYWYLNLLKLEKITFFKDEFFVKKLSKKLFSIKNSFLKKLFFWWIKQKSNFFLTNNFFFNPLKTKIIKSNKKFNFLKYYFKKFNFFFSRIFFKKYLFGHDLNSLFFTYKLFYKFKLLFKQRLYLKFFNLKKKPKKNLKTKVLSFQSNLIFFHFNKTFNKKKIKLVKTFKISEFLNNYFKNFYILKNSKKLKKFIFYFNKNKFFKKNDNFKLYASLVKRYGRLKKKNSKLHSNVFLPFLYFSFLKFNSGVTFKSFIYFKNNILNFSFKKFNKCHLLNNFFFNFCLYYSFFFFFRRKVGYKLKKIMVNVNNKNNSVLKLKTFFSSDKKFFNNIAYKKIYLITLQYRLTSRFYFRKKLMFFFLKNFLDYFFSSKINLNLFNCFKLLNKFNKLELYNNIFLVKNRFFQRKFGSLGKLKKPQWASKRSFVFLYWLFFMKIFFFSFRLKQFGLLSLFFCKNIGVKKKKTQWRAIKQLKSLINCIKMLTLDYLGFHLCIIGTINGRKRATRYHIVKTYKASIQDLRLDIHYVYNQSVSVHGALGIHFWVFF